MKTKKNVESELEKLEKEIADAEDGGDEDDRPVRKRAADVARKSGETAKRQKAAEIDAASETTMQGLYEETKKVRELLENGKISGAKAKTLFEQISSVLGFEDEEDPEDDDEDEGDEEEDD